MKKIYKGFLVLLLLTSSIHVLNAKCVPYSTRGAGWAVSSKNCTYTFTANKLTDSSCFHFAWYQGKTLLGTGNTYTKTFSTNDSAEYKLVIKNICDTTCADTSITKKVVYHCAPKCIWKDKKPGYTYSNKACVYTFEADNLNDSCIVYKWFKGADNIGTGRFLTYTFTGNSYSNICLKVINTCKGCDTSICKIIQYSCAPKCIWKEKKPGYTYTNKDCVYTFEANNLMDSCIIYKWYKDNVFLGSGKVLTHTFSGNNYNNICLKLYDNCNNCDTSICKIIQYGCATKCNWKDRNAGWGYVKSGCTYKLEATNLRDSCITYTWVSGGKVIGTGRLLTYEFKTRDTAEICLKLKDTCKNCDTTICKALIKPCTSGLGSDLYNQNEVKVYPNPANGGFEIEKLAGQNLTLKMFDLLGTEVNTSVKEYLTTIFVDTKTLSNGVYFIQLNINSQIIIQKIVVQH